MLPTIVTVNFPRTAVPDLEDLMPANSDEQLKPIAAQLLSALLANPHIYATISDEGAKGQQEQRLLLVAIDLATDLIASIDRSQSESV